MHRAEPNAALRTAVLGNALCVLFLFLIVPQTTTSDVSSWQHSSSLLTAVEVLMH